MEPALRQRSSFFEKYSAPCAWQASSMTMRLYWVARSRMGSMSAICPYKCTGMAAVTGLPVRLLTTRPVFLSGVQSVSR